MQQALCSMLEGKWGDKIEILVAHKEVEGGYNK